jgi:lysozyme family protein
LNKLAKVSFQVASKYFDFLINAGEKNAKNVLIKSINELGYNITNNKDMNEDILLAVKEIVMTNKKEALINNFIKNQKQYYITIAEKRPQNKKFLNGWLRRAEYHGVEDYG